ncbi:MAG: hypothetical protein KIT89_09825 [Microcella sp.]|uniref:ATP-binding protein n=1 Tax=Microcella sp. TaxID=1913979 RepID=UPI0024C508DF|nr:ATP-binding protein [Microcella sp.]UYN83001.1 MAG: hypothetical protein KIT89_09825 [Microcella sp.]
MDARGIAARMHDLPTGQRRAAIAAFIIASVGIALWSLQARSPDVPIALWWPASGALFFAVLASRGRRLAVCAVIVVTVAAGNVLGGHPLDLSIAYGITNAVELWIVVRVLTGGAAHADFTTLKQIGWFLVSVGVAISVFSVLTASAAFLLAGADPVVTAVSLFTSHGSALFAIAPLALVPIAEPLRAPRWEPLVQTLSLVFLAVVVFALAQALALTFLILTTLMWGAYRLPPLVPAVQNVVLAIAATLATALGVGPFAVLLQADLRGAVFALQLFIMTHAAAALFVAGQSAEWRENLRTLAQRERDAQRVADELRLLNSQKDDFISAVSHELRTPVTSIIGFSETLVDDDVDPDVRQAGHIIYRNARRLADVIEDVLELSRLSTASVSTRAVADVDMTQLLQHCIEDVAGLVPAERHVRVDLRAPERAVVIRGVEQDLVRVSSNLLSNAIKFSPPDGTVTVRLIEHDDVVELIVVDEGPGIPPSEQDAIWERFYRVQTPRHRDVPGTGLGLPIVKSLLQSRIGGDIVLTSDGERGTTVTVRIPRTPPASLPEAATDAQSGAR